MYGGIETGGTKTVCAVGGNGTIVDRVAFPTGDDPTLLLDRVGDFFAGHAIHALGVGTFGPCDPNPESASYGRILATPKTGWVDVDLLGMLAERVAVPSVLTTDVGAAALGELRYGAGQGYSDLAYVTIGTGIGGGIVSGGQLVRGAQHPEPGHMLLPFDQRGVCKYHTNCWEGLASGPAMQARLGFPASELPDDDPAWELEAAIVAAGLHNLTCTLSPQLIILGGGVGSRRAMHERVPELLARCLAGYVATPVLRPPALGPDSGVIGALALAETVLTSTAGATHPNA
jgi:fructokinase